jgi:translation elongation factor EF-1beta
MENVKITDLISEIRSNEEIIHELGIIEDIVFNLPYISNKLFVKDSEGNLIDTDEYLKQVEDFCSHNALCLMRENRRMFIQIKSIKE